MLGSNWRSAEEVVRFNNEFFHQASALLADKLGDFSSELGQSLVLFIREAYDDVAQEVRRTELPGYVEARFGEEKGKEEASVESLKAMIDWVNECIDSGYQYQDMAILVSENGGGDQGSQRINGSWYSSK